MDAVPIAEPLYLRYLKPIEKAFGEDDRYVASACSSLAFVFRAQGKYEQAESLYLRAVDIAKRELGEEHADTMQIKENLNALREEMKKAGVSQASQG